MTQIKSIDEGWITVIRLAKLLQNVGVFRLGSGSTAPDIDVPSVDSLLLWDQSALVPKFGALADFTTEASPAAGDYVVIIGAEGDVRVTNWSSLPGASSGISQVKTVYLTSGSGATYTPTSGTVYWEVWCTGQGGGGGGADGDGSSFCGAGGGGGGGTAYRVYSAAEMGATALYTVGAAAGAAGSGTNGTDGTTGTDSTFDPAGTGPTLTGSGGVGGIGTTAGNNEGSFAGGAGGSATASGGQVLPGGGGANGTGIDNAFASSGCGGGTFWGGGPAGRTTNGVGTAGTANTGAGGSGATNIDTTTGSDGGAGGSGIITIKEYIA